MEKLKEIEKKLEELAVEDKKTKTFKFKDRKFLRLAKKAKKTPEYVLVQYLRNNRTVDFKLCRVVAGNLVVINNKGYELNPKHTWIRGKYVWYIIREKDTKPVSIEDEIQGHSTDDHQILIKLVLGAVQKKEIAKDKKKIIGWIIILAIAGLIGWIVFGG